MDLFELRVADIFRTAAVDAPSPVVRRGRREHQRAGYRYDDRFHDSRLHLLRFRIAVWRTHSCRRAGNRGLVSPHGLRCTPQQFGEMEFLARRPAHATADEIRRAFNRSDARASPASKIPFLWLLKGSLCG